MGVEPGEILLRYKRCLTQCVYKVLGLIVQSEYYARHQVVTPRNVGASLDTCT